MSDQPEQVYPVIGREEVLALRRQFVMSSIIKGLLTDKDICDAWNRDHPSQLTTPNQIQHDRKFAIDELNLYTISDARQMRSVLAARYNTIIRTLEQRVLNGDLRAIDKYIAANTKLADLFGANMPAKISFTDPTGTKSASLMTEQERLDRLASIVETVRLRSRGLIVEDVQIIDAER